MLTVRCQCAVDAASSLELGGWDEEEPQCTRTGRASYQWVWSTRRAVDAAEAGAEKDEDEEGGDDSSSSSDSSSAKRQGSDLSSGRKAKKQKTEPLKKGEKEAREWKMD